MPERATREWSTSPTMATWRPAIPPNSSPIVNTSRRAWVGCWCLPSPALTTWTSIVRATSSGEPIPRVADHDDVGVVGGDRERRVLQGLALVDGRAGRPDRHHVRGEPLGGELEAGRRPRRGLVEEVDDGAAAQRRQLLHVALERACERPREGEQTLDVLAGEVGDRDEMPARRPARRQQLVAEERADVGHCIPPGMRRTRSVSSISTSCTWMRSLRAVGRFLPT